MSVSRVVKFGRGSKTFRVALATLLASGVSAIFLAGCGAEPVRLGGVAETGAGGLGWDASRFDPDSGRAGSGAGGTGSGNGGAADVEIPPADAHPVDPKEYYCNLPEPSPCCCEAVVIE